jgi:hypothetical protein
VFVVDDLISWLTGRLAEAGYQKVSTWLFGSEQDRALKEAVTAAVRVTVAEIGPSGEEQADQLAQRINDVFGKRVPVRLPPGQSTRLEALRAGIAGQLSGLDDAQGPATGLLGVPAGMVAARLTDHLISEILARGSGGGPLEPLANQFGHELTHSQLEKLNDMASSHAQAVRDQTRVLEQTLAASIKPLLRLSTLEPAPHRQSQAEREIAVSRAGDETLLEVGVRNAGKGPARITAAMIAPMFVSRTDLDLYVEEQGYEEGHAWIGGCFPNFAAPGEHATVWFRGAADPGDTEDPWNYLARFLTSSRCEVKIDYEDEEGHQQASLVVTIGLVPYAEGDPTPRYVVLDTRSDVREALIPIG